MLVLKAFQAGGRPEDAIGALTEVYQVSRDQAERDVGDFQDRLRSFGLL
jgi:hypothetical protein